MQRDVLLIAEMIEAAQRAAELAGSLDLDDLTTVRDRREALLWNFAVLGEAAAQITETLKDRFPDVEWAQPSRLRNRIIHGYWSIDLGIVHTTAVERLPAFLAQLREVLADLEAEGGGQVEPEDTDGGQ